MARKKWEYAPIPSTIHRRKDLTLADKAVAGIIAKLQGGLLWVEVSHAAIGRECATSARHIKRIVRRLVESGAIECRPTENGEVNHYSVPEVRERNSARAKLDEIEDHKVARATASGKLKSMPKTGDRVVPGTLGQNVSQTGDRVVPPEKI